MRTRKQTRGGGQRRLTQDLEGEAAELEDDGGDGEGAKARPSPRRAHGGVVHEEAPEQLRLRFLAEEIRSDEEKISGVYGVAWGGR